MKQLRQSWGLPCGVDRFWEVFFEDAYSRALYLEGLQFKGYRVISLEETSRKLHLSPKLNVPGPVAKLIGDSFAYEQHGSFDRAAGLFSWRMVQPGDVKGKPGAITSSGTIRVTADGADRCTRTDQVTVSASVFGLAGMIESAMEKELKSSWDTEIAFFKRWIAERG